MSAGLNDEILRQEGFQRIGQLNHRLQLPVWWNPAPDKLLQVLVLSVGPCALIKGEKSYYLKSVSAEGETWARDIGSLHDYLESHFPEVRVSFSHFRDVPPALAQAEVRRRMAAEAPTQPFPTVEEIAELQRRLHDKRGEVHSTESLLSLSTTTSDLLTGYARQQTRSQQREVEQLEDRLERQQQRHNLLQHLQCEFQHKGSAAVYCFSISSNVQVVENAARFHDALRAVVKELSDYHRFQIKQKLGGRLNIHVAEATEPVISWIELWLGGAISPKQLERIGPAFDRLRSAAQEHMMVTPDEPILVDGHVRHAEKHLGARFVANVLQQLDKSDRDGHKSALNPASIPPQAMPLWIGQRIDDAGRIIGPAVLPLTQVIHGYISGTTGSGKSFLARVLVEEATKHIDLNALVLDPRSQFSGLLVREDRPPVLKKYEDFGMKPAQARGFPFRYFAPGLTCTAPLPQKLSSLATGRSVVSFKGMDDQQRCTLAAKIMDAVFDAISDRESERPRLLIVIDEAQLLTRRRVDESARAAAARAERALDRIAREGRKYGIVMLLVSQTVKDFGYELASLRQMTNTKIFLRNSDREIDYAADIIGDGKLIVQLATGVALAHHGDWGVHRIRIRPPYSKVFELPASEIRQLLSPDQAQPLQITSDARNLLAAIKQHGSPPNAPLNLSQAAALAGITSRRQLLDLIDELEHAGAIRTRKLPERGCPRVIELASKSG